MIARVLGEMAERSFHQPRLIADDEVPGILRGRPVAVTPLGARANTFLLPTARQLP